MSGSALPIASKWIHGLLWVTAFSIPLSVKLYFPGSGLELIFPAEPLIAIVLLIGIGSLFSTSARLSWDRRFMLHPLSISVAVYLGVSAIAAAFSTMPMVSAKALMVRTAYIMVFYFAIGSLPFKHGGGATALLRNYALAFLPVVIYSFANQVEGGLDRASAGFVSYPFFIDHTIYAAALVFVLFLTAAAALRALYPPKDVSKACALGCIAIVLLAVLYLSFCRAAWVSALFASLLLAAAVLWRYDRWVAVVGGMLVVLVAFGLHSRLPGAGATDSNAYRSGARASILSLTNVTTDPSNLERLNRWSCARRMFLDRPWTGFGPGTYQFNYVGYQLPEEISSLSVTDTAAVNAVVNSMVGNKKMLLRFSPLAIQSSGGTAHSEYLLTLSESGAFVFVAFLAIVLFAFRTGMHTTSRSVTRAERIVPAAIAGALVAYFVHAGFNNFLDDCKIAFPFWASLALLARLDRARPNDLLS
ncbi:MAG: O-antigen ligase family protein [Flavobacteriales bacterium]